MLKSKTARAHIERTDYSVFSRSSCALEIVPVRHVTGMIRIT
jgi:hypothetical protein